VTIRLTLLGSLQLLDGDGKEVRAVLAQPKRLALLSYLVAHEPGGFCSRDALVAMFWPEFGEQAARAALSRAVYYLRHALGADVVVGRGDRDLGIDEALLTSDLRDLREALRTQDTPAALALYRGDLLDGFHVDDAAEFSSWLDRERQRLRDEVARHVGDAAASAGRRGDLDTAATFGREACRLSPYDEDAMTRLMTCLEAAGRRSEALVAFEAFTRRLNEDLDAAPRPDLATLADRIRRSTTTPPRDQPIVSTSPPVDERMAAVAVQAGAAPPTSIIGATSWSARFRRSWPWSLAAVMVALPVWFVARGDPPGETGTVRFTLTIPQGLEHETEGNGWPIALSPDGKTVVYVGRTDSLTQLFTRRLDQASSHPVPGTEEGEAPFFSPDGRWLGYWTYKLGGQIRKMPVTGGESAYLGTTWWMDGVAWLPGDTVIVGTGAADSRMTLLAPPNDSLRELPLASFGAYPVAVPGHDLFLFNNGRQICIAAPRDSAATPLDLHGSPVGVLDGWLLYIVDTTLTAIPSDIAHRRITGQSVQLLDGTAVRSAAVSANGTLVYVRRSDTKRAMLVDLSGGSTPLTDTPLDLRWPAVSPDGKRIAFTVESPHGSHIAIYDLASKTFSVLVTPPGAERPSWTDGGKRIGYTTSRAMTIAADGSGTPDTLEVHLPGGGNGIRELTFAPSGRYAVMRDDSPKTMADIWLQVMAQPGHRPPPTALVRTPSREGMPRVSPDGHHLAFASDITGMAQVFVQPFPGPGPRVQVSGAGGLAPVWAPDGSGIFYRWGGHFMFAKLTPGPHPAVISRRILFPDVYAASLTHQEYDVMPDGKHLVVLEPYASGANGGETVNVIVDWLPELRRAMAQAQSSTTTPQQP
jgi:DNA-binding SARP family transcriptional activator/Tol biopolymer transport system component